jgi:ribosomal protein S18 acetylase RimI-like enzyme
MDATAFADFLHTAVPAFAADKASAGEWAPAQALALSQATFDRLLPQGQATPGHHFFSIHHAPGSEAVGTLWWAEELRGAQRIAYVYDLYIAPAHRRQGHAGRALLALEIMAQAQGLAGIALHVFGHNLGAQALYARLGFVATNINLMKPLAPVSVGASGVDHDRR